MTGGSLGPTVTLEAAVLAPPPVTTDGVTARPPPAVPALTLPRHVVTAHTVVRVTVTAVSAVQPVAARRAGLLTADSLVPGRTHTVAPLLVAAPPDTLAPLLAVLSEHSSRAWNVTVGASPPSRTGALRQSHDRVTSYQTGPHLPGDGVTLGPVVTETVLGTILAVLPLRTPHLTLLAPPARPTQALRQSAELVTSSV